MHKDNIISESLFIPSNTQGIELHLIHKFRRDRVSVDESNTIIMMHGATYSSESLFDTPAEGASFIDVLASKGFNVYAVNVRGYGASTRPPEMSQPAENNVPAVRTDVAVRDFSCAVNYVLGFHKLNQVNIIGMSWGGTVAATFTSRNNHHVRRLGLIAPQWLSSQPVPLDEGGTLHAWRIVNAGEGKARWLSGAPQHKQQDLIPAGVFEAWVDKAVSTEPDENLRMQNSFRASNGPVQDIRDYWTKGKPYYDPADIRVPLLLIHGEWDRDVPVAVTQDLFLHMTGSPDKRWLEIGEATHMVVLEKNRHKVFDALANFFSEPNIKNSRHVAQ
ncbi:alpha/beta hydrolase [Pantoea alhagi]|nr:alpha/beta hydrolase [Pantoea alhagi]